MAESREDILEQIEAHRVAIFGLEQRLAERGPSSWPPVGFYLTFYVVSGLMIGILGSLASFLFNVAGSLVMRQDPLLFLRVYGTVFLGARALTTEDGEEPDREREDAEELPAAEADGRPRAALGERAEESRRHRALVARETTRCQAGGVAEFRKARRGISQAREAPRARSPL